MVLKTHFARSGPNSIYSEGIKTTRAITGHEVSHGIPVKNQKTDDNRGRYSRSDCRNQDRENIASESDRKCRRQYEGRPYKNPENDVQNQNYSVEYTGS